jgi:hypothetical protein
MNARDQEAYQHIKAQLRPDLLAIDQHLIEQPQWQMDAAEYAATAAKASQEMDVVLEATKADAMQRLREVPEGGKKPPQSQLDMDVLLEDDVMEATAAATDAKYDMALWRGLVDALRSKASVMKTAAELINSGYLAPRAAQEGTRAGLDRARQAAK